MTLRALYQAREFAFRAGVTVRTLHHYDRLGLLKPSGRTASGYRLYSERDFARLQQITTLKFIGLPLKQIKVLLEEDELNLAETLRLQRKLLELQRRRLDAALAAIAKAESVVASGVDDDSDWGAFKKIIEVIEMENNMDWVKSYYTDEQLAELDSRWSPEVQEKAERDWASLIKEVQEAMSEGVEPASERAQALAARWTALIGSFTGGNPAIAENLKRLYADQANWPATFKRPYPDDASAFIAKAVAARHNT